MKFTDKKTRTFIILLIVFLVLSIFQISNVYATTANFGYETIGAYVDDIESIIRGSIFTLTVDGVADKITVALKGEYSYTGRIKCAVYLHSDLSLKGATQERTIALTTTASWYVFNFSVPKPSLTADIYILVVWAETFSGPNVYVAYATGTTNQGHWKVLAYDGFPNPLVLGGHANKKYSIYCTYTVGEEKTWNNAETWKLNLYALKWFASELWKINIHTLKWFSIELWRINLYNFTWNLAETWKLSLYPYSWFLGEVWKIGLHAFSWFNVETWKITLSTIGWYRAEIWKIGLGLIGGINWLLIILILLILCIPTFIICRKKH